MHQDVVIDQIEALLQVHIDHRPQAVLHVLPCAKHCIVRTASRPKAVAVLGERRIDQRLQHLQQGLVDQPIRHRRNPQLAHSTSGLRDLHAPHRRGPVAAVQQRLPNPGPVRLQVLRRLGDRASIHPGTAAIGFDAFPRRHQIRSRERLRKQTSPRAFGSVPRLRCFVAQRSRSGFTLALHAAPRLPGLLTPCTSERHDRRLSHSFGPSPRTGSYYGLC